MNTVTITKFNIRVYGLFINTKNEILLADEERFGMRMTKFPGGGLQFGEGPVDCLKREAREEFGQEINVLEHFYTTGFFQKALFYDDQQLVSIYYRAWFRNEIRFSIAAKPFEFDPSDKEPLSFRFANIHSLKEADLSFPIDRHVLNLLQETL